MLIDHRVVKYLDSVAVTEHESIHRIDAFKARVRHEKTTLARSIPILAFSRLNLTFRIPTLVNC